MFIKDINGKIDYFQINGTSVEQLNINNYLLSFNEKNHVIELSPTADFKIPNKIYGKTTEIVDRVFNTYLLRSKSTGVMLGGEKGSGKSLFIKLLTKKTADKNMPVILINEDNIPIKYLFSFINHLSQSCLIVFDEIEKNFSISKQEELLSVLDGSIGQNKHLFVIAFNNKYKISSFFFNRPDRLLYYVRFDQIDPDFVQEYCEQNLNNKEKIADIVQKIACFSHLNFDMLQNIVEEINRYDENIDEVLWLLNVNQENKNYSEHYNIKIFDHQNQLIKESQLNYSPTDSRNNKILYKDNEKDLYIEFSPEDIVEYNRKQNKIVYIRNGYKAIAVLDQTGELF